MDFTALAQSCAPGVHPVTIAAIARVESSFNELAIGVVGGRLERQPRSREEAVATVRSLAEQGYNFSVGISQVNRYNLARYGLTYETAFDPCANLGAGSAILSECFGRAKRTRADDQVALRAALSCYYSGNFSTGFSSGYVAKVVGTPVPAPPRPGGLYSLGAPRPVAVSKRPTARSRALPPQTFLSPEGSSALLF